MLTPQPRDTRKTHAVHFLALAGMLAAASAPAAGANGMREAYNVRNASCRRKRRSSFSM